MRAYNRTEARAEAARIKSDPDYLISTTNADLVAQYLGGMKYASRHLEAQTP